MSGSPNQGLQLDKLATEQYDIVHVMHQELLFVHWPGHFVVILSLKDFYFSSLKHGMSMYEQKDFIGKTEVRKKKKKQIMYTVVGGLRLHTYVRRVDYEQ